MKKIATFGVLSAALLATLVSLGWKAVESYQQNRTSQLEKKLHFLETLYQKLCSSPEMAMVTSAVALQELGKKQKLNVSADLEKAQRMAHNRKVRNLLRLLLTESYKKTGNFEKVKQLLGQTFVENNLVSPPLLDSPQEWQISTAHHLLQLGQRGSLNPTPYLWKAYQSATDHRVRNYILHLIAAFHTERGEWKQAAEVLLKVFEKQKQRESTVPKK